MSTSRDWIIGYAREADADLRAWELYGIYPQVVAAECHKLMFLQMACEKLCKAYLVLNKTPPQEVQKSHAYVSGPLPVIIKRQILIMRSKLKGMKGAVQCANHLAREIELLSPAVDRNGKRPDNCEYPWLDAGGTLHTPLDWTFPWSELLTVPSGRTFLKLLREAINGILQSA